MPTFADYLSSGSGAVEFRLAIEGCSRAFVTSEAMAGTGSADKQLRTGGLLRSGLVISESASISDATLTLSLGSATIEDTSADDPLQPWLRGASSIFSVVPRVVGYLSASLTAGATVINVIETKDFVVGGLYHINTECFVVESVLNATQLQVTRAMLRTSVQAHYVETPSAAGSVIAVCPIYDAPMFYAKRRVWIYGHGADELDPSSDGTLITRGMLSAQPTHNGDSWQLSLAPITQALDQDIGAPKEPLAIRGIYYSAYSPFRVYAERRATSSASSASTGSAVVSVSGFWETQAEWCAALTAAMNTNATVVSWGNVTFAAQPTSDGGWTLNFSQTGTARFLAFGATGSGVDGFANPLYVWFTAPDGNPSPASAMVVDPGTVYAVPLGDVSGLHVSEHRAPYSAIEGLRTVPRANSFDPGSYGLVSPATLAAWPWWRLYLDTVTSLSISDELVATAKVTATDTLSFAGTVTAVDVGLRYVDMDPASVVPIAPAVVVVTSATLQMQFSGATLPEVSATAVYTRDADVSGFITSIVDESQDGANAGRAPFLVASDFQYFTTRDAIVRAAAQGRTWLLHRSYRFAKRLKLADVLKHELRLYGLFMHLDVEGRIAFRPITTRTQLDFRLTASDIITNSKPKIGADNSIVTGATVKIGYDPAEDKHTGRTIDITAVGASAMLRAHRPLEVAPKSNPVGLAAPDLDIFAAVCPVVQLFSSQRFLLTVSVPVTHARHTLGDSAFLSIPTVPYNGSRSCDGGGGGLVNVRGTLTGKRWDLSEPCATLTFLLDSIDAGGYSPTARVTGQSGAGSAWTLTTQETYYGDGTVPDASYFLVGDKVRLVEWDADVPVEVEAIVTAVAFDELSVSTTGTWTPGIKTWNVMYAQSDTAGLTPSQRRYANVASSTILSEYAGGETSSAKTFAP